MTADGDLLAVVERLGEEGASFTVTVDLSVTVDGTDLTIQTFEDRLHVRLPSVWEGISLLQSERERLPELSQALSEAGLTAEIRVDGAVIALVGEDATPGTLSDLLDLGPVEVHPRAVVPTLLQS